MQRLSQLIAIAAVLLVATGCGYPTVSAETYDITKALYSACNRQSMEHVVRVQELVDRHLAQGQISDREANWLHEMIEQARDGHWESAALERRSLLEDQVK